MQDVSSLQSVSVGFPVVDLVGAKGTEVDLGDYFPSGDGNRLGGASGSLQEAPTGVIIVVC